MTPNKLARDIVSGIELETCCRILEPSCGDGAFIRPLIENTKNFKSTQLIGVESDKNLADKSKELAHGYRAKILQEDFFRFYLFDGENRGNFDLIIGNPPFGGTFDPEIEDSLDNILGRRFGRKIKKETYAFFIVACMDLLKEGGRLTFICSNSLLTIATMAGLRSLLMQSGEVRLRDISEFSQETGYPMLILDFVKGVNIGKVQRNSCLLSEKDIKSTMNLSWGIKPEFSRMFSNKFLQKTFVGSGGMTTGKNELFVRSVSSNNRLTEPYNFIFYNAPITVAYELERARLRKLTKNQIDRLSYMESIHATERRVRIEPRRDPKDINLPNPEYVPYNKANGALIYSEPTHYIYWKDEGDAVLTYKKTGNWYLRGVGGVRFFGREGITWQLIGSRFTARYLPPGYVLDSGAPVAIPRDGEDKSEILFILGWILTDIANDILKNVINHTRNIQGKDFERMPYPYWVNSQQRDEIVALINSMIEDVKQDRRWKKEDAEFNALNKMFSMEKSRSIFSVNHNAPNLSQGLLL